MKNKAVFLITNLCQMNIVIYGTGGVGGYFGTRLVQSGNNVTFIARGKHLEAIKKNGLQLNSIKGDYLVKPANVTANIEDVKGYLMTFAHLAQQVFYRNLAIIEDYLGGR